MMEAIRSSETQVLIRVTRRHIYRDAILHSHRKGTPNLILFTYRPRKLMQYKQLRLLGCYAVSCKNRRLGGL
jgi:hypothetical protein